jgi:hypothetical protein
MAAGAAGTTDQDVRILGDGVHVVNAKELNDATEQSMEEAERHGVAGWPSRSCWSS